MVPGRKRCHSGSFLLARARLSSATEMEPAGNDRGDHDHDHDGKCRTGKLRRAYLYVIGPEITHVRAKCRGARLQKGSRRGTGCDVD
ncbi:hypothetical protein LY78DRAFT_362859 [Colletotrichum sublineola]|nr:hypothetical protein LY78DRAFT_362859 [Colletotrichum sublineola]